MTKKINILCIDTSTEGCSVAVLNDEKITSEFIEAPREHTQKILPLVQNILIEAGLQLSEIDLVAYGRGPGSFTGVRIGISIAQGLAFGIEKPMIGVSTLQAMSQEAYDRTGISHVYAGIDARMGEVYFAHYKLENDLMVLVDAEVVIKPCFLLEKKLEVVKGSALVGSAWNEYPQLVEYFNESKKLEIEFPNSKFMLKDALKGFNQNKEVEPEFAIPVYLRDTITWKKLPGKE